MDNSSSQFQLFSSFKIAISIEGITNSVSCLNSSTFSLFPVHLFISITSKQESSHIINLHTLITTWWPTHNFSVYLTKCIGFFQFPNRKMSSQTFSPIHPNTLSSKFEYRFSTLHLHSTSILVKYHPFHMDSKYTFYLLVLQSYIKTLYHWMVDLCTVWLQHTSRYTNDSFWRSFGCIWLAQMKQERHHLYNIFTIK